jgi:hypothetical protein
MYKYDMATGFNRSSPLSCIIQLSYGRYKILNPDASFLSLRKVSTENYLSDIASFIVTYWPFALGLPMKRVRRKKTHLSWLTLNVLRN